MSIENLRDDWFADLESKSDEFKAGAHSALQMIIAIGHKGFSGDCDDLAHWLEDKLKEKSC